MAVAGRNNAKSGMLLAGAVGMLALPSAVLAFSTQFEPKPASNATALRHADEDSAPRLAGPIPMRSLAKGPLYPFTPAGTPNRPDRSVTVAVRVDPITVRGMAAGGQLAPPADGGATPMRIAPTAFALGVSRGYRNFAQDLATSEARKIDMPDLGKFTLAPSATGSGDSRLSPRIVIDEKQAAGRAPRTFAGDSDDQVDLGGSYRLTRNINVTAGVRYTQDRERLRPLTDGKQDNQAVYLGTQFRF
jgi:hypothetical protein